MTVKYQIHPRIGVARLGNSTSDFYLSPETIGGLPLECDENGNPRIGDDGQQQFVTQFKDDQGRLKRQAAQFKLFKWEDGKSEQVDLNSSDIEKIEWTVHIANKKPIWYTFSELQGDLEFGEQNSYENQRIGLNNSDVTDTKERKNLIIDPGPRTITAPTQGGTGVDISRYNAPDDYPATFPPVGSGGQQIDTLGELRIDERGNLVVLAGLGHVTGSGDISSFRGAGGYWDDIADGYVLAKIHLASGEIVYANPSWLIVGSPKYAPELVNITTLYDTAYDTAIRQLEADTDIYNAKKYMDTDSFYKDTGYTPLTGYNPDYVVNYHSQVKPILERMQGYRWVADAPYLASVSNPTFDMADASDENQDKRQNYFTLFRMPVKPEDYDEWMHKVEQGPNQLFSKMGVPLLPLNSGDNSVTNQGPIYKFETLSLTQYFFLQQWANGKFTTDEPKAKPYCQQLDEASIGNCVGAPFSPGIEVTWIVRNAPIYFSPVVIKVAHYNTPEKMEAYYQEHGLSLTADEARGDGYEPGDLTKRMAIPWQADFHECTV